jgi:4-carboxymuconolactone decarboxylase
MAVQPLSDAAASNMPSAQEKLEFLNAYARNRGYAHRTHRLLANYDLDAFKAMNPVPVTTAANQRLLSKATKELLFVANFACLRAPKYLVATHIKKAIAVGATEEQILETIELLMPESGRTIFEEAMSAFEDVHNERRRRDGEMPKS